VAELLENKSANAIFWSPKGRHVVTATLGSSTKFEVDFWDFDLEGRQEVGGTQSAATDLAAGIQLLATAEHYGMTAIEWDPSGRYVTLAGTTWQTSVSAFPF
jgi:translation initiation factor 3 subunit B